VRKQMIKLTMMGAAVVLFSALGTAAPACTTTTYDVYISQGSCSIGNFTFSNFSTLTYTSSLGQPRPAATQLLVTPSGDGLGSLALGFNYQSAPQTPMDIIVNTNGAQFGVTFTYNVVGAGAPLEGDVMWSTFSNTTPGSASATKNSQLVSGGTIYTSTVSDQGGSNALANRSGSAVSFVPATPGPYTIQDSISLQAQTGGAATLRDFTNVFAIPEPLTGVLLGSGLVLLGLARRRRK
jgi:hypothetical protein